MTKSIVLKTIHFFFIPLQIYCFLILIVHVPKRKASPFLPLIPSIEVVPKVPIIFPLVSWHQHFQVHHAVRESNFRPCSSHPPLSNVWVLPNDQHPFLILPGVLEIVEVKHPRGLVLIEVC